MAPVIAIDGPAGSGKSTLARRLARVLGLPYLNTGLMYRALTLEALRRGLDLADENALARLALELRFDLSSSSDPPHLLIGGVEESSELMSPEVERHVSLVSSHPRVREVLRTEQRRLGAAGGVVEGRDIGSVVFPDADVKVLLLADPRERARRRVRERERSESARDLGEALEARDALDARINPFVPAAEAVAIDTTGKDADEVFAEVLALVRERLGGRW